MSPLVVLLGIKIAVTFVLVGAPFLFLPADRVEKLSGFSSVSPALFRLYGVAICALLVGYAGGLVMALSGAFPWGVAAMGIVSNGGAAAVLGVNEGAKRRPMLTLFFSAIALGLLAAVLAPDAALRPL